MLKLFTTAIAASLLAIPTYAHEFDVTLLVPEGDEVAATQAFLLASAERDSHANETSEGHLGGVDSQLTVIAADTPLPPSEVVVALAGAELPDGLDGGGIWSMQLAVVSPSARAEFLETATAPFAARYRARYGTAPTDTATLTYVAARLIDIAVRAQDGVDDIAALETSVKGY